MKCTSSTKLLSRYYNVVTHMAVIDLQLINNYLNVVLTCYNSLNTSSNIFI